MLHCVLSAIIVQADPTAPTQHLLIGWNLKQALEGEYK